MESFLERHWVSLKKKKNWVHDWRGRFVHSRKTLPVHIRLRGKGGHKQTVILIPVCVFGSDSNDWNVILLLPLNLIAGTLQVVEETRLHIPRSFAYSYQSLHRDD